MSCSRRPAGPLTPPVPEGTIRQLVEPLAGLICAADCPRDMLHRVLDALRQEVGVLNGLAREHAAVLPETFLG
jgi:hypothetical protein